MKQEKMEFQSRAKAPVKTKDYQRMIDAINLKMGAQPKKIIVAGAA